jgi:hypothetical protein
MEGFGEATARRQAPDDMVRVEGNRVEAGLHDGSMGLPDRWKVPAAAAMAKEGEEELSAARIPAFLHPQGRDFWLLDAAD